MSKNASRSQDDVTRPVVDVKRRSQDNVTKPVVDVSRRSRSTTNGPEEEHLPEITGKERKRKMTILNHINPGYSMGSFADDCTTPQAFRGNHIQFQEWKSN